MSSLPITVPWFGPPMSSIATFPTKTSKSAQDNLFPYFSLIGHNNLLALSKFPLSGQEFRGAKR